MSRRQLNPDDPLAGAEIDRQIDEIRMGERPDSPIYKSLLRMKTERDEWRRFIASIGSSSDLVSCLEHASMAGFAPGYLKLWSRSAELTAKLRSHAPLLGVLLAEWWAYSVVAMPLTRSQVIEVAGPGPSDVFRWESPAAKEKQP